MKDWIFLLSVASATADTSWKMFGLGNNWIPYTPSQPSNTTNQHTLTVAIAGMIPLI
jgi:hypothetical protein